MTPCREKHYSLPFLPATPLSPSQNLERLFKLTQHSSRALDSPRTLLPELQRYKDAVRCQGPRTLSRPSRALNLASYVASGTTLLTPKDTSILKDTVCNRIFFINVDSSIMFFWTHFKCEFPVKMGTIEWVFIRVDSFMFL